jgi:hypothetical protein
MTTRSTVKEKLLDVMIAKRLRVRSSSGERWMKSSPASSRPEIT